MKDSDYSPTEGFSFGMRLGCVREDHKLSMSAMAKSVGVAPSTWSNYEDDRSFPGPQTIANSGCRGLSGMVRLEGSMNRSKMCRSSRRGLARGLTH